MALTTSYWQKTILINGSFETSEVRNFFSPVPLFRLCNNVDVSTIFDDVIDSNTENKTTLLLKKKMEPIQQWWNTQPAITRWLFAGSFGLTLAANFGLVNPAYLILDISKIFKSMQAGEICSVTIVRCGGF
jgi:hypothetical protein